MQQQIDQEQARIEAMEDKMYDEMLYGVPYVELKHVEALQDADQVLQIIR